MLDRNRLYIERLGLLSVIILSSESKTVKDRMNIVDEIVCIKNEKPFLMTVRWIENPIWGFGYKIEKSKEISDDEYKKLIESRK